MSADTGTRPEAGRELDALVAEKVFGYRHLVGADVTDFYRHRPFEDDAFEDDAIQEVWVSESGREWWCRTCGTLPSFSTDIADAWRVVEKMREREPHPWMVTLTNWRYYDDLWYEARFASHPLGPDTVFAKGDTPALAICRAALLALDAEGELGASALSSEERSHD